MVEKQIRVVKKSKDEGNLLYWLTRTFGERMAELEKMRQEVNSRLYGARQGFQRVYKITQRT